ncbi:MAG: Coq4 family protein [Planctomycetota bacterium]
MSLLSTLLTRHKKHHTHATYLTALRGAMGMIRNPENTQSVFDIEDGLRDSESTREALRYTARDPAVQEMIRERFLRPVPDTDRLKQLDKGTLGREYVDHLDAMGFDPDYYRKIDVNDDVDYILMRLRQTHDIWHVVTGFSTSPLGEICVKAVELAQTHRPMAAVICAGGTFRYLLHDPKHFGDCVNSISIGYQLGLKARPLLSKKWEDEWERPLDDIRDELDVTPIAPDGAGIQVYPGGLPPEVESALTYFREQTPAGDDQPAGDASPRPQPPSRPA